MVRLLHRKYGFAENLTENQFQVFIPSEVKLTMFTAPYNFDINIGDADIPMELIQLQCEAVQIKLSVGRVPGFVPTYLHVDFQKYSICLQNMPMFGKQLENKEFRCEQHVQSSHCCKLADNINNLFYIVAHALHLPLTQSYTHLSHLTIAKLQKLC
jgi:hypothetical protein